MNVKELLNGAKLPNWVYALLALGVLLFQAGILWAGKDSAVKDLSGALQRAALQDSLRTAALQSSLGYLNEKLERRTMQINAELHQISVKTGYIARQVE